MEVEKIITFNVLVDHALIPKVQQALLEWGIDLDPVNPAGRMLVARERVREWQVADDSAIRSADALQAQLNALD